MNATSELRRVPGVPRALLRASGGRRARRTRALTGATDWRRAAVDALAFSRVAAGGTTGLPPSAGWPWPAAGPGEVEQALRAEFPALVVLGAVLPRQAGRRRLSLLCHAAGNPLVVKLGTDARALDAEYRALCLLAADPLPGIATPRPLAVGTLAVAPASGEPPVGYLAMSALGLGWQRPAFDATLRTFESDLAPRLAALPRPDSTDADDLVPVHGDLTPWNLRRTERGLALFDWEHVGWGRRGSDVATYRQAAERVGRGRRRGTGGTA